MTGIIKDTGLSERIYMNTLIACLIFRGTDGWLFF